jgi:hypothetical protein
MSVLQQVIEVVADTLNLPAESLHDRRRRKSPRLGLARACQLDDRVGANIRYPTRSRGFPNVELGRRDSRISCQSRGLS